MFATTRPMPNIFILGAKRSGTASLTHYLEQHPAIQFTEPRATSFFLQDELYNQGIDYYSQSFCRNLEAQPWRGEASPAYFAHPHTVGPRLRQHYGDQPLKFIVLLREPVSRAWSHYLHRLHHGYEKRDFATALDQEAQEPQQEPQLRAQCQDQCNNPQERKARYFAEGRYSYLLHEWQNYYPLESFKFLLSEDLTANPLAQVRRIFVWLGVDTTMPIHVNTRLNGARYSNSPQMIDFLNHPPAWLSTISRRLWPESWQRQHIQHKLRECFQTSYRTLPPLDPEIAMELRQRYRGDILTLSKMLGRYLSHWLSEDEPWELPIPQMAY